MPKPSASRISWRFSGGRRVEQIDRDVAQPVQAGVGDAIRHRECVHRAHHHVGAQAAPAREAVPTAASSPRSFAGTFDGHAQNFVQIFETEIHALPGERVQHARRITDEQHARRRLETARHELFEREAEALVDRADGAVAGVDRPGSSAR